MAWSRTRIYIEPEVQASIRSHVREAVNRARDEFYSASEDEDSLTGHLGARLQVPMQVVNVTEGEVRGPWRWKIAYTKFRGRGPGATERYLGADGILTLVLDRGQRDTQTKAMLFQSKMGGAGGADLVEQALKLSTWREASAVFSYAPDSYRAAGIDDVLRSKGLPAHAVELDQFLDEQFLACLIGDVDLSYDAVARKLSWRDMRGEKVAAQFSIPHRIAVTVKPPPRGGRNADTGLIDVVDVHRHRMAAAPEEILGGADSETSPRDLAKKRREILALYHPDRFAGDDVLAQIANRRAQEINAAFEELKSRRRDSA